MKVQNMTNAIGNQVANQFVIEADNGDYIFQSYHTIIARKTATVVILDRKSWDYSQTTGKYRNLFLGESKKETERKIKAGIYQLADLN
jgi:hypothetical protein